MEMRLNDLSENDKKGLNEFLRKYAISSIREDEMRTYASYSMDHLMSDISETYISHYDTIIELKLPLESLNRLLSIEQRYDHMKQIANEYQADSFRETAKRRHEEKLREEYPMLKNAWDEYQFIRQMITGKKDGAKY